MQLRLLLLLLLCGHIATAQPADLADFPTDAAALTDLFRATGLPYEANSSMCSWLGVTCKASNTTIQNSSTFMRVVNIELTENMRGFLPDSIGQLDELVGLRLTGEGLNELTGTLPSSLGNLEKLELLVISNHRFNGSIPASLGRLARLRTLNLGSNTLSGTVPPSLGNLGELSHLFLGSNKLVGSIPDSFFANMSKLDTLFLFSNQLSGSVPESLFNCSELVRLYLYSNSFSGTLSAGIGKLAKLRELSLVSNQLSGTLPDALFDLTQLESMYLSTNRFFGTVPNCISNLSNLMALYLGDNQFQGTVPDSLALISGLEYLDLSSNFLVGPIPPSFGGLVQLEHLSLASNALQGAIPSSLKSLSQLSDLDLSNNMLTGDFDLLDGISFFPSLVNVSYNLLGPVIRIGHLDVLTQTAVIDIRVAVDSETSFVCPYPVTDALPGKAVLLRSPCTPPYDVLAKRAILLVAVVVCLFLIMWLVQRKCQISRQKCNVLTWALVWIKGVSILVLDVVVLLSISQSLRTSIADSCHVFNSLPVFENVVSVSFLEFFQDLPASTSFSEWLSFIMSLFSLKRDDPAIAENLVAFRALCQSLTECDVDMSGTTCVKVHPELAATGGAAFPLFCAFVIAVLAVRIFLETTRIACVVLSCWQGAILEGRIGAELARSSFAAPLCCFFFPASDEKTVDAASALSEVPLLETHASEHSEVKCERSDFFKQFVSYAPTPFDYFFRLAHLGILSSIPLLILNLYFLLRVSQTGMATTNWLSLVNLLWTVPRQIGQAIYAKWCTGCSAKATSSGVHGAELSTTAVAVDVSSGDAGFEALYSLIP